MTLHKEPIPAFSNINYVSNHLKYRAPPPNAMAIYLRLIAPSFGKVVQMLDVGAGTGHFCIPYAKVFPAAKVVALEPSAAMAQCIQERASLDGLENIEIVVSALGSLESNSKYDVILVSEVAHLFDDLLVLIDRLRSLLAHDGVLAFRTPSHEQLATRDWYRFFPRARFLDIKRHPSLSFLEVALNVRGFSVTPIFVDETQIISSKKFLEMFDNRVFSVISLLPESEYQDGICKLRADVELRENVLLDYKMSMILASNHPGIQSVV